ncbi:MAG: topoisomerase protein [Candidatus Gottesmanbacteria bacterium GW2011_GWB1_43_11]|uniref:DNA topoisomerase 1 n=1 Tax=Candidatus Gottesmanbacteria bacterium GW2011_GWB1_43_11 TaxID=1618446 RepID=A0A0G1CNV1_9BACT|nr:MAG: topoisomerase protein [Candidatus Gottesmanbacteria bacterium GW2011_GWB1_43_11]HCM37925.1 type I DNA topoisomerase [Patescibacteria group bacterium]
MNLILVESPTKARTLSKFLGDGFRVEASFGHLRDLPKGELGVDVENNFTPRYVIPRDKARRVKELRTFVDKTDRIILATDPDREGEAIAWHLEYILTKSKTSSTGTTSTTGRKKARDTRDTFATRGTFERITFHEITEEAIKEALTHPGKINLQLVNAQQARRILDRLVGYKLSPLLWRKLSRKWLSAGRVQSVSVRLIVEREREIGKFNKQEYWVIEGEFVTNAPTPPLIKRGLGGVSSKTIIAQLISKNGIKYEQSQTIQLFDGSYTYTKTSIPDKAAVDQIIKDVAQPFTVSAVDKKETKRSPAPPYTTSAMQIDAGRKLGYTSKRIMQLAQNLYEEGLITYHRTDSVNLSTKFLGAVKAYIEKTFGPEYSQYRTYATKSKLAQEAHEAIRPTDIRTQIPELRTQNNLTEQHFKLYDLIWKRAIASQMKEAIFDATTIQITSNNGYLFQAQGSVIKFDGYLKVTGRDQETIELPSVVVGDTINLVKSNPLQKFTQPPPRYSEASLIKALEEDGIGRPSTYAPTISTIVERGYVEKETREDGRKGRNFVPTELGILVNDFLVRHFPNVVDLRFTATMEEELDDIAEGKREWQPVVAEFYKPFVEKLNHVLEKVETIETPVVSTGQKCPECKAGDEIIKEGRFGKFLACSRFPECKYTKNLVEKLGIKCPDCKEGDVVVKKTRTGRIFYGCSRYPDCKYASWTKPKIDVPNSTPNPEVSS